MMGYVDSWVPQQLSSQRTARFLAKTKRNLNFQRWPSFDLSHLNVDFYWKQSCRLSNFTKTLKRVSIRPGRCPHHVHSSLRLLKQWNQFDVVTWCHDQACVTPFETQMSITVKNDSELTSISWWPHPAMPGRDWTPWVRPQTVISSTIVYNHKLIESQTYRPDSGSTLCHTSCRFLLAWTCS